MRNLLAYGQPPLQFYGFRFTAERWILYVGMAERRKREKETLRSKPTSLAFWLVGWLVDWLVGWDGVRESETRQLQVCAA
jgi:hypothetical protein